jgi:hypothetical protein
MRLQHAAAPVVMKRRLAIIIIIASVRAGRALAKPMTESAHSRLS